MSQEADDPAETQSTFDIARHEFREWRRRRDERATLAKNDNQLPGATELRHPPLPPEDEGGPWIRILTIEPGEPTDHIRCALRCVNLDDNPAYRALSYSWEKNDSFGTVLKLAIHMGPRKNKGELKPIACNSQTILIQANLYSALLHLRKTQPGDYWVDALCINQDNASEKNLQIRKMARIYRSAQSVVVWLGPCPRLVSVALDRFAEGLQAGFVEGVDSALSVQFWLCRWFSRIWVIQEMCFARDLVFLLGDRRLAVGILLALTRRLSRHAQTDESLNVGLGRAADFPDLVVVRDRVRDGDRVSLAEWMQICRKREASDPRDIIFGGLALVLPETLEIRPSLHPSQPPMQPPSPHGHVQAQGSPPLPPRPGLPPLPPRPASAVHGSGRLWPRLHADYNAQVLEVLVNLAAALLSRPDGGMQLLSIAVRARSLGSFCDEYYDPLSGQVRGPVPSWVPNLNAAFGRAAASLWAQPPGDDRSGMTSIFAACNDLPANPRIMLPPGWPASASSLSQHHEPTLVLDAARLGTVELSRFDHDPVLRDLVEKRLPDFQVAPHHLFHFMLSLPPRCVSTGLHVFEALARVMTAGIAVGGGRNNNSRMSTAEKEGEEREKGGDEVVEEETAVSLPGRPDALRIGLCRFLLSHRRSFAPGKAGWESLVYQESLYRELQVKYPEQPWPREDGEAEEDEEEKKQCGMAFHKAYLQASRWRLLARLRPATAVATSSLHREGSYHPQHSPSPPPPPLLAKVPGWVRTGDTVVLVKGGAVPLVLARRSAYLRREREILRHVLDTGACDSLARRVEARASQRGYRLSWDEGVSQITRATMEGLLEKNAKRTGHGGRGASEGKEQKDDDDEPWVLIGEAFVEGVMYGEALEKGQCRFERISIV